MTQALCGVSIQWVSGCFYVLAASAVGKTLDPIVVVISDMKSSTRYGPEASLIRGSWGLSPMSVF